MNRFGHGGRQKRLIIGQVRVKVENLSAARPLESIVRKLSCDIPAGRGEQKKGKKKETRAIKKPVSGLKSNYSSCLHSADIVAKRSTATRSG